MPPYLPAHHELVELSGVAEFALGLVALVLALRVPRIRRWTAWGIIALLIAVFPANLHVALNNVPIGGASEGLAQRCRASSYFSSSCSLSRRGPAELLNNLTKNNLTPGTGYEAAALIARGRAVAISSISSSPIVKGGPRQTTSRALPAPPG